VKFELLLINHKRAGGAAKVFRTKRGYDKVELSLLAGHSLPTFKRLAPNYLLFILHRFHGVRTGQWQKLRSVSM